MRWIVSVALALAACSPGVGREPNFPDATARPDAGFADARVFPDAEPYDAGPIDSEIVLPDTGPPIEYEFTGVFGILNSQDPLYAREVDDQINIVIDDFPYVYTGTITAAGDVEASSLALSRRGCARALVYGHYDRTNATFVMTHETCNVIGEPLFSNIRGGFRDNFDILRSGVYQLEATVIGTGGCYTGPMTGVVRYGVNYFSPGNAITIFTAVDLISTPQWYRGGVANDAFSARDEAVVSASMMGSFSQASANEPLVLTIPFRDVYDPLTDCGFTMSLQGARIIVP